MDINALLQRIFEHVEDGEVDKAVRACLRLSRHVRDYMNSALFLRELVDKKSEIARLLLDDTSELKEEAQKYGLPYFDLSADYSQTSLDALHHLLA